jgi:hypothetical protein
MIGTREDDLPLQTEPLEQVAVPLSTIGQESALQNNKAAIRNIHFERFNKAATRNTSHKNQLMNLFDRLTRNF